MKLSAITNKHPDGQWFEYAGVLKVKLKFGQGIETKLNSAMVELTVKAGQSIEGSDLEPIKQAEQEFRQEAVRLICEDYFLDFESVDGSLEDDEGNAVENTLANRMMLLSKVEDLHDFVDVRISTYSFWT